MWAEVTRRGYQDQVFRTLSFDVHRMGNQDLIWKVGLKCGTVKCHYHPEAHICSRQQSQVSLADCLGISSALLMFSEEGRRGPTWTRGIIDQEVKIEAQKATVRTGLLFSCTHGALRSVKLSEPNSCEHVYRKPIIRVENGRGYLVREWLAQRAHLYNEHVASARH